MNIKKTVYLALALFVIWCLVCSAWYIFSVKGLTTDPANFSGHSNAIAIVEILFMTLGAFLIGFLAAYYLQEEPLAKWRNAFFSEEHQRRDIEHVARSLQQQNKSLASEKSYLELHYKSELAQKGQQVQHLSTTLELQKQELVGQRSREEQLKEEISELQPKAEQLEAEISHLRFKIKQLEYENQTKQELRVPKEDEISDLTEIHGIGPAISRKLYAMGIYSFKQISQFDDKMIQQVGKALKFFPDRIIRDNWVGQAKRLVS